MIRAFRSALMPEVYAFATDPARLPTQFAPWYPDGNAAIPVEGIPSDVADAMERDGYFLSKEGLSDN